MSEREPMLKAGCTVPSLIGDRLRMCGSLWVLRALAGGAALALCAGAALAGVFPTASFAASQCGNETTRAKQGAQALSLPECRAYELVTEPKGAPTVSENSAAPETQAAVNGGAVALHSWYSPAAAESDGHTFVATRGSDGWQTSALDPTLGPDKVGYIEAATTWASADVMSDVIALNPFGNVPEPPVVTGEPTEGEYLLRRGAEPVSYQLMNPTPEGVHDANAIFQGASQDFSSIFFSEASALVQGAPTGEDLYVWREGTLRLAAYLPGGAPVQATMAAGRSDNGGELGRAPAMAAHAISADGERIVFESGGALYLRENVDQPQSAIVPASTKVNGEQCAEPAEACTVQLDAAQGGSGASGGGQFWGASAEGSRVFFTDTSELTANAHTTTEKPDLYEYDVEGGTLTDLTADASEPAAVQGVAGVSQDGGYVYFVAEGVLTETPNARSEQAVKRKRNLYVSHDGAITFIATLFPGDAKDWGGETEGVVRPALEFRTAEIAPGGRFLAFNSVMPLTGYDNAPAGAGECGEGCDEIFLYDAERNGLHCVSCGQPGSRPAGETALQQPAGIDPRRQLMANGRVFFSTPSALLLKDTDETYDVYEWTPVGVAACEEVSAGYSSQSGGCLYLISSGVSAEPSYFADASEGGGDVFFTTEQALLASDTDNEMSLYDARVEGGFSGIAEALLEPPVCENTEACGPPPAEPPAEPLSASSVLSGPGNLLVPPQPGVQPPPKKPGATRAQKLAEALKACRKTPKRRRHSCEAAARGKFGGKAKRAKKSNRGAGR